VAKAATAELLEAVGEVTLTSPRAAAITHEIFTDNVLVFAAAVAAVAASTTVAVVVSITNVAVATTVAATVAAAAVAITHICHALLLLLDRRLHFG